MSDTVDQKIPKHKPKSKRKEYPMLKVASKVPGKVPGKNPSPIGTQDYPVYDSQDAAKSEVEKEAAARKRALKEQSNQRKRDD